MAQPRKSQLIDEDASTMHAGQGKTVLDLLLSLRVLGVELRYEGDRVRVNAPPGVLNDEIRQQILQSKPAIVAFLAGSEGAKDAIVDPQIPRAVRGKEMIPVTYGQQRLWILQQLDPEASVYNLPYAFRIEGDLDVRRLEKSLVHLVERHDALRTTFVAKDGVPRQRIGEELHFSVAVRDDLPAGRDALLAFLASEARRPFDLQRELPIRASILSSSDHEHVLFFNIHHIVCDGWSIEIFLDELVTVYEAMSRGMAPTLPPLPIDFADFALWEQSHVTPATLTDALTFFRRQLSATTEALDLPTDRPRGGVFSYRGSTHKFSLDDQLVQALTAFGQRHGATPFMVMLTAFNVMLSRFSGQKDVVVGSPVSGRQQAGTEKLIGFFVNTVVLRTDLSDDPTFVELLSRVRQACLSAYQHQALPFQWLVEALNPSRDRSRTAIYQAMFAFQDARERRLDRAGLRWTRIDELDAGGAKTDLTLLFEQNAGGMAGWLEFSTDLFDRETIERFAKDYETLLRAILAQPERSVARLDVVHPDERHALRALNATARPLPRVGGFHELLQRQALQTPSAVAVIDSTESLTYAELERRANRLANHLVSLGVGRGSRVGVAVGRTARMLQATLGVLKAGAAYVPLDPDFPRDRLDHMLKDAELNLVISEESLRERVPPGPHRVLSLDGDAAALAKARDVDPGVRNLGTDPAYVIYTSGSTGRPKGVMLPHAAVVNFLVAMAEQPGCKPDERLVAVTTLSFDIAVLELFLPLTVGARTIIANRDAVADGARLIRLFTEHGATMMQATPVTWQLLLDAGWTGSPGFKALCGGEAFPAPLAKDLIARCGSVWNMYGPTETTVWSTSQRLTDEAAPILIGKPIANTQLHVLDEHRQQVPFGVTGELFIGGRGVALGYLNRPELTEQRFVADPFSADSTARMYRTGDLVRQRPEGVQFVGRADNQIKLRGHRIELGEIESVLNDEATVARSAVVVRDFGGNDKRIVAYVVGADAALGIDADRLRQQTRARLPDYMVPQHIVVMDALPLTPNGKIDRKALPAPDIARPPGGQTEATPANALESLLVSLWCRTLQLGSVGVTDNFFDLGGHSLLAVRLVQLIAETCGVNLSLAVIFKAPTIREQALCIDRGHEADGISVVPLHRQGEREPLFCICGINLYQDLARNLDANRPVFGVFLPVEAALFAGHSVELSVKEMASEYAKAIRAQQPEGPYHLAGVSFGGVLAYETAQQLREAGEEVGVLAILDVVLPEGLELSIPRWIHGQSARLRDQGPRYAVDKLRELSQKAAPWLEQRAGVAPPFARGSVMRLSAALRARPGSKAGAGGVDGDDGLASFQRIRIDQYDAASKKYQGTMRPYAGSAIIFRARDEERPVGYSVAADCGWSKHIAPSRLTIHEVPGDHLGILTEPHVRELAGALRLHFAAQPGAPRRPLRS